MPKKRRPARNQSTRSREPGARPARAARSAGPSKPAPPRQTGATSLGGPPGAGGTGGAGDLADAVARGGPTLRRAVEGRSAGLLRELGRLPLWAAPAVLGLVLLLGLVVQGWIGSLLLLVVLAFVVWLTYLAWPRLRRDQRLVRLGVTALVAVGFLVMVATI